MRTLEEKKIPYEHYSAQFAKRLFKRYPTWREYAGYTTEGKPEEHIDYLSVRVPTPNPNLPDPFVVSTNSLHEVTLSWFGGWHIHIFKSKAETDEDYFSRVLSEIDRIISEQVVVATCYRGQEISSGSAFPAKSDIPSSLLPKPDQRLVIRSWRGTYDREIAGE